MEKRTLGNTGLEVSALGFGGAEIGRERAEQRTVDTILRSAIDAGLNVVDTAAAYFDSEQLIGNSLAGIRRQVVLMSKCGALDGFTREDWSKEGVLETITASLSRLKTDYLDVIQLHSCDAEVLRRGEAIEALIVAKERGYARFAGYSGDSKDAEFALGLDFFDTLQTSVSIADQEAIDLTVPVAVEKGVGVIAKRPVANVVWTYETRPDYSYHQEYWDRIEALDYPFLSLPLPASVGHSLRFTLSVEGVATAIVGTTKPGRWKENAGQLMRGALSDDEFESIRGRWNEVAEEDWVGQV